MLAGGIGISSPGQFSAGAIGALSSLPPPGELLPAPFDRTFFVPQDGLPWEGQKTPGSITSFSFNWAGEGCGSDAIVSSTWAVESSDLSVYLVGVDRSATIATALIAGGVAGNIYNVTNTITTESGLKLQATFRLFVSAFNW